MSKSVVIVNASWVVTDAEVEAKVGPLQKQIDRDFQPHWGKSIDPDIRVSFAPASAMRGLDPQSWPIFLNRHSTDKGALGWHDDDPGQHIRTYSRVFVGDCLSYGLDWGVTLSHEALELILDPDIKRVYRMVDGRFASLEACDAVEDDTLAYDIDGHKMSDFVLPAYFSSAKAGPFDFGGHLHGNCPALTDGGYMSVTDASGQWTQLTADRTNGLRSGRALMSGHRRHIRAFRSVDELEIVEVG